MPSVTDYLMLMAYDQHWSTGEAGPVAGQDWYRGRSEKDEWPSSRPRKRSSASAITATTGRTAQSEAETVSFQESLLAARESLDYAQRDQVRPGVEESLFQIHRGRREGPHVWFLDAVTAYNEIESGKALRGRRALPLASGQRGPVALEGIRAKRRDRLRTRPDRPSSTATMSIFEGTGEILQVKARAAGRHARTQDGRRPATISDETYQRRYRRHMSSSEPATSRARSC